MKMDNQEKMSWQKLKEAIDKPVTLSDLEKKKFKGIVNTAKDLLDDSLEVMCELSRDEAYRYLNLLINAFQEADAKFVGNAEASNEPITTPEKIERPRFDEIFDQLTSVEQEKARRYLDCVKNVFLLKTMLEDPSTSEKEKTKINIDEVLCCDKDRVCSVEEMRKCINTEDPTVKDEMDIPNFL